jgi:hypothetical protein
MGKIKTKRFLRNEYWYVAGEEQIFPEGGGDVGFRPVEIHV